MRKGTCIHFRSTMNHETCEAGVVFRDVTPDPDAPGSAFRIPCNSICPFRDPNPNQAAAFDQRGTCEKFQEPTEEQIKAYDSAIADAVKRVMIVGPLLARIRKEQKGKNWQGVEECPACQGRLHLSIAKLNGHIHASCETENCISFME